EAHEANHPDAGLAVQCRSHGDGLHAEVLRAGSGRHVQRHEPDVVMWRTRPRADAGGPADETVCPTFLAVQGFANWVGQAVSPAGPFFTPSDTDAWGYMSARSARLRRPVYTAIPTAAWIFMSVSARTSSRVVMPPAAVSSS